MHSSKSFLFILMSLLLNGPCFAVHYTPLFELEKDDKISYGIGTYHSLPLDTLPKCVSETLKKGEYLVHENLGGLEMIHDEEFCEKYGVLYRPETNDNQPNPFLQLDSPLQEKIENLMGSKLREKANKDWKELSPWAIRLGALFLTDQPDTEGMDAQIATFFISEKMYSLETPGEKLLTYQKIVQTWEKTPMSEFLEIIEKRNVQTKKNMRISQELYLQGEFKKYVLHRGKGLLSPHIVDRNKLWLPIIKQYHTELEGTVVFRGGYAHWIGEQGILNDLYKDGFKIRVMDAETATFQPFDINQVLEEKSKSKQDEDCVIS